MDHKWAYAYLEPASPLPLLRGRRIFLGLQVLQRDSLDLIALPHEDRRGDGAVHPARHANHNRPLHRYRAPPRCETGTFAACGAAFRGSSTALLLARPSASQVPCNCTPSSTFRKGVFRSPFSTADGRSCTRSVAVKFPLIVPPLTIVPALMSPSITACSPRITVPLE